MNRLMILGLFVALCMMVVPAMAEVVLPITACPPTGFSTDRCTSNDVVTKIVSAVPVTPGDVCTSTEDTLPIRVTANFTNTAQTRYDFAVVIATGGEPLSGGIYGNCIGGTSQVGQGNGPNFFLDEEESKDPTDTCGDMAQSRPVEVTATFAVNCSNIDVGAGTLTIESCRFWDANVNDHCDTTTPNIIDPPKCDCDPLVLSDVSKCIGKICNDENPCTDDTCSEATGACVYTSNDTNVCADSDACNGVEACVAGSCTNPTDVVCPTPDQCHNPGVCDTGTGLCSNPAKADNTVCVLEDNNPCTDPVCTAGVCVNVADDTNVCADNDACNGVETCVAGSCTNPTDVVCDDENDCTDDSCVPATGKCLYEDNGQCNPWCGLTIGYWKNNIKKYQTNAKGRQVCDAFFTEVSPSEVCQAVTPGECTSCTNWQCIYNRLDKPGGLQKNTIAQMTGTFLTGQAEGEFGDFVIDTSLYEPISCTVPSNPATCVYPACKVILEDACEGTTCDVGKLWVAIADAYADGDLSTAHSIAGCVNEFNDACKWTGGSFTTQQCDSIII